MVFALMPEDFPFLVELVASRPVSHGVEVDVLIRGVYELFGGVHGGGHG
jgi:hypothetical protein